MGQVRRLLQGNQCLVGFQAVLVVVRVTLQLEQQVVGEPMRGIPAVLDCHLLVSPVSPQLPPQSVVLNVVDGFQIENGS